MNSRIAALFVALAAAGCAEMPERMSAAPAGPKGAPPTPVAARAMTPGLARVAMRDTLQRRHLYNPATVNPDLFEEGRAGTSYYETKNLRITDDSLSFDYEEDAMEFRAPGWSTAVDVKRKNNHIVAAFRNQPYCTGLTESTDKRGAFFVPAILADREGVFAWQDRRDAQLFCDAWNELVRNAQAGKGDDTLVFASYARAWRERPESRPAPPAGWDRERILAEQSFKARDVVRALEHFEAGLRMYPPWPEGWFNAALLYEVLGDYEYAANRMRHYLELEPGASDARAAREKLIYWEEKARRQ